MENASASERILRQTPSFVFARVVDAATGRGLLCVTPRDARSATQRARLRAAAGAHRAITHPYVARLHDATLDGDAPSLRFDLDAVADGDVVVDRMAAGRVKVPFDAATGFIEAYAEALIAAHATTHPDTGVACCLGAVGWPCFFFDARGSFALVGFGAPLALELRPPSVGAYVAPDVLAGAAPSPGSDVLAFTLMQRNSLALVALPDALARVFASAPRPDDLRLAAAMAAANFKLFVGAAASRPAAADMLSLLRRTWRRLGVTPDASQHRALVATLLASSPSARLRVAHDAAWFQLADAARVSLSGRGPLRRVLDALVTASMSGAAPVSVAALVAAGWPGERMRPDSGAGRVYVALSTLRRMGLADAIERYDDGYRLRPDLVVERL